MWVRMPAGRWVYSRSVPMTSPTTMAQSSLMQICHTFISSAAISGAAAVSIIIFSTPFLNRYNYIRYRSK